MAFILDRLRREHRRWLSMAIVGIAALYLSFGLLGTALSQQFWRILLAVGLGIVVYWVNKNM